MLKTIEHSSLAVSLNFLKGLEINKLEEEDMLVIYCAGNNKLSDKSHTH